MELALSEYVERRENFIAVGNSDTRKIHSRRHRQEPPDAAPQA